MIVRDVFENKVETKTAPPKKYLCEKNQKAINEAFSDEVKHDEKEFIKLNNLENLELYIPELT